MADQASTPTSGASPSSKPQSANPSSSQAPNSTSTPSSANPPQSAPKDKSCPFCGQPFTSSSLGRHLDLYIKEKNPKPADGLHDVDEIRKMRGAITRRQPRGAGRERGGSTPGGTPGGTPGTIRGGEDMGTPSRSASVVRGHPGAGAQGGPAVVRQPMTQEKGKVTTALNQVNWQSTGVINNIPLMHQQNNLNGGPLSAGSAAGSVGSEGTMDLGNGGGQAGVGARPAGPGRTVSRQVAAKNTFEQKQKMLDAMEGQRAAELALRELLGSIKAAITVAQPSLSASPFNFDPLSLDFPSLVLTCLPPPPTLTNSTGATPIPNPNCWFTDAPSQAQFKALGAHIRERFHSANVMRTIISSTPPHPDDILFAHHATPEVQQAMLQQAKQYEEQVNAHLHESFRQWSHQPESHKDAQWKVELARFVGLKSQKITALEQLLESVQQENAHLKHQVESLSRLQNPKEFALAAPQTTHLNNKEAVKLAELGMRQRGVGFKMGDTEESLQKRVEQAVERWKPVVRRSRAGALAGQRSLSGQMRQDSGMGMGSGIPGQFTNGTEMELDSQGDQYADGDAEADEEDYSQQQAQAVQMQQRSQDNTPMLQQQQQQQQQQPHMIQPGYPNIQQQQAQQSLNRQQSQQNINGMAMMTLQQQHAQAQAAQQAQQAQMQAQNQNSAMQNQGQQIGQTQMGQGQSGEINMSNGHHMSQGGMSQAQQQQMAAMRRQQQQQQQQGQMGQRGGGGGGRIGVPF